MTSSYQCGAATIVVFRNGKHSAMTLPSLCGRVRLPDPCPRCKALRDEKLLQQIHAELFDLRRSPVQLYWNHVPKQEVRSAQRQLMRDGARYAGFPQEAGGAIYVADQKWIRGDGQPLPDDPDDLAQFVSGISFTPPGCRYSPLRAKYDSTGFAVRLGWGRRDSRLRKNSHEQSTRYIISEPQQKVYQRLIAAGAEPTGSLFTDRDLDFFSASTEIEEKFVREIPEELISGLRTDDILDDYDD